MILMLMLIILILILILMLIILILMLMLIIINNNGNGNSNSNNTDNTNTNTNTNTNNNNNNNKRICTTPQRTGQLPNQHILALAPPLKKYSPLRDCGIALLADTLQSAVCARTVLLRTEDGNGRVRFRSLAPPPVGRDCT